MLDAHLHAGHFKNDDNPNYNGNRVLHNHSYILGNHNDYGNGCYYRKQNLIGHIHDHDNRDRELLNPTSFFIYYTRSSSNSTSAPANFFKAIEAPGGSGIVLAPEAAADSFTIDEQNRLVDTTGNSTFIAKNTDDLYPFDLLETTAANANIARCSACNGVLTCNYPGSTGNTFALCYGYLALGPPDVFGKDSDGDGRVDCKPITLRCK